MNEVRSYDSFIGSLVRSSPVRVSVQERDRLFRMSFAVARSCLNEVGCSSDVLALPLDLSGVVFDEILFSALGMVESAMRDHENDDAGPVIWSTECLLRIMIDLKPGSKRARDVVDAYLAVANSFAVDWVGLEPSIDVESGGSWASPVVQAVCVASLRLYASEGWDDVAWENVFTTLTKACRATGDLMLGDRIS